MFDAPILDVRDVHTYYSSSHVLKGVSLSLERGAVALVGRNGMGKTTLVKSVMGLVPTRKGKILLHGEEIQDMKPYEISSRGIGYVPQGRELFPSLSVEEHLLMAARGGNEAGWDMDHVYELFPRLRERSSHGAAELSGGEQQMLAIGRALVTNPSLLLMDEPSEGLAPIILDTLIETYHSLIESGMSILLIEQNLRTATELVDELYVMVKGHIVDKVSGELMLHDKDVREKYMGVKVEA